MSTKNNVVRLIGNKLFITLLVFALAIIMISSILNRNAQQVAKTQKEALENIPVVSESNVPVIEEKKAVAEEIIEEEDEPEAVAVMGEISYRLPLAGELQRKFSTEELVWDETMKDWRTHNGIDIAADVGTEVDTAAPGTVTEVYEDEMYGFVVKVRHNDNVVTVYKNLQRAVVKKDDAVDEGQMIGTVGDAGAFEISQKPHLHFEVISDDKNINPLDFIK